VFHQGGLCSVLTVLLGQANDLPILYYFRKVSRPCAAVGCCGFLALWLLYFHRPLSLVAMAWGLSDVEVWILDLLVIRLM